VFGGVAAVFVPWRLHLAFQVLLIGGPSWTDFDWTTRALGSRSPKGPPAEE